MGFWSRLFGRSEPPHGRATGASQNRPSTATGRHSSEKAPQPSPPFPKSSGKARGAENGTVPWYTRESSARKCKQIIMAEKTVSLCKSPIPGPLAHPALQAVRAWGMGTVFSGNAPYLCVKCVGVEEAIKTVPCRLAFAFYRYPEAGLFQPLLEIPYNPSKPFIVENPWNLRGSEMAHIAKQLLAQPYIVIQFFNARMVGVHARVIRPPAECMAAVRALLDEACKYDSTLPNADFRAAENRYYDANPAEETPVLKE